MSKRIIVTELPSFIFVTNTCATVIHELWSLGLTKLLGNLADQLLLVGLDLGRLRLQLLGLNLEARVLLFQGPHLLLEQQLGVLHSPRRATA